VLTPRAARQIVAEMQTLETWFGKNVPKFTGLFETDRFAETDAQLLG